MNLPVSSVLPEVEQALLSHRSALLEAPPGAGKSTLVPPFLLQSGLAGRGTIYLLEPRRLAARSLAFYISGLLGDIPGGLCGYRVHRESKISQRTRIEVITEGVMLRLLQEDPALEKASLVIFDEFHERNLLSDLTMSLLLEVRQTLREDLMLLFMSATPDCQGLARLIPHLPQIRSEGRQYPVDIRYHDRGDMRECLAAPPVTLIDEVLKETPGNLLVFLPGEGEIRRWEKELIRSREERRMGDSTWSDLEILPLYGRLSLEQQNRVISPPAGRPRRLILATDIAETSLTIQGVTVVIDTGLSRRPRYDSTSGLTLLTTEEISLASAEQRAGRAGRTSPGICYRLWNQRLERGREKQSPPEILQADLSPLVLELALWGTTDPENRSWMTTPPRSAWESAVELLQDLGALDPSGGITARGRKMAALPVHPRIASLLLYGWDMGQPEGAALLGAFLEAKDFMPRESGSDMLLRLDLLERNSGSSNKRDVKGIRQEAEHLLKLLRRVCRGDTNPSKAEPVQKRSLLDIAPELTAGAYPDRIAQRIEEGFYQLSGGGRVLLDRGDPLAVFPLLVAPRCGGQRDRQKLFLGMAMDQKDLEALLSDRITEELRSSWDQKGQRIRSESRRRLGEITLSVTALPAPSPSESAAVLKKALLQEGLEILKWDKDSRRLWDRMNFAGEQSLRAGQPWPGLSRESLAESLETWLIPFLSRGQWKGSLVQPLLSLMDWEQQQYLARVAPDYYKTSLGNRRKIEYSGEEPFLPVPLQEMYGTARSPLLGDQFLVLHLLNPAGRPVQITADLESFWENVWPQVRKELKGRYPKHYWPEDPAGAEPSLKTGKNRPD